MNFVKLCRDSPDLLGSSLDKTDVDLIFVRSKKKGERRINYTRFLDALGMIASQKYGDMVRRSNHTSSHGSVNFANYSYYYSNLCIIAATRIVSAQAIGDSSRLSTMSA